MLSKRPSAPLEPTLKLSFCSFYQRLYPEVFAHAPGVKNHVPRHHQKSSPIILRTIFNFSTLLLTTQSLVTLQCQRSSLMCRLLNTLPYKVQSWGRHWVFRDQRSTWLGLECAEEGWNHRVPQLFKHQQVLSIPNCRHVYLESKGQIIDY